MSPAAPLGSMDRAQCNVAKEAVMIRPAGSATPLAEPLSAAFAPVPETGGFTIAKGWPVSYSHWLPDDTGRSWCGHNATVSVQLAGRLDPNGMVYDYGDLGAVSGLLQRAVDHRHLDDLLPGSPASCREVARRLASLVYEQICADGQLPFRSYLRAAAVADIWPDPGSPAWHSVDWSTRFHAAHWLAGLPEGHQCRRRHGHGYQVGVEIEAAPAAPPADSRTRWLWESAEAFVRSRLDQRSLNDALDGLNPTAEHLACFLYGHFTDELGIPGIRRVLVAETPRTLAEYQR